MALQVLKYHGCFLTSDMKVLILHKDDKADVLANSVPANMSKPAVLLRNPGTLARDIIAIILDGLMWAKNGVVLIIAQA